MKKRILFVDDEGNLLASLRRMLSTQRDVWDMTFLDDPRTAWRELRNTDFDAVVLDIHMPYMDGLEILKRMRQLPRTEDVPVIILTALSDNRLKRSALDLGATDLLNKPVEVADLEARLRNVLRLKAYQDELKAQNEILEQKVRERTRELDKTRLDIIWRLSKAVEIQDQETGNHVVRVGCYSRRIAETMKLDREFVECLFLAAPLHDIGKIGIPSSILMNPGKLNPHEWAIVKDHALFGEKILRESSSFMTVYEQWHREQSDFDEESSGNPILEMAAVVALNHHEKWDGSGYPRGLAGEDIPLEARIVAIADVYDALSSQRPYKRAFSHEEAMAVLNEEVGFHFDPAVYGAFIASMDDILDIREGFSDDEMTPALAVARR